MTVRFELNGAPVEVEGIAPSTTLLQWLRTHRRLTGTKEGCAEGDCGACTVVLLDPEAPGGPALRSVNSCLMPLPMLHGRRVWTVEGVSSGKDGLHSVQQAMVDKMGSQCGYCTPGIVMSLVEAHHRTDLDADWKLDDQLCGNLCRCTGYRPIREAAELTAGKQGEDAFSRALADPGEAPGGLHYMAEEQVWVRPTDLAALWTAVDDYPEARLVCGATDIGLEITKRRGTIWAFIDLSVLPELRRLEPEGKGFFVGAAVRLADLERWAQSKVPPVARMLRYFGARQIKHQGTVGGNLCNASPIGDLPPILLALNAVAVIGSAEGERRVPLADFFVGYRRTALQPGEVLLGVVIPRPSSSARIGAYKVSKRRELDISAVAAGFYVRVTRGRIVEARLAFGGMAATPSRAPLAEAALVDKAYASSSFDRAAEALAEDFSPIDDHRGTAWYRATVARNLLLGFYEETQQTKVRALPDRPAGTVMEVE